MFRAVIFSSLLIASTCSAFLQPSSQNTVIHNHVIMQMSTTTNEEATGEIKASLKKMRGVSVSVEFNPLDSSSDMSLMEMEILSQELRKAKAASIWTSSLLAVEQFAKEQSAAKGNFPGPSPIVYFGSDDVGMESETLAKVQELGASAIVLDADAVIADSFGDVNVDIICKVDSVEAIGKVVDAGFEYAFLIPGDAADADVTDMLSAIPKSAGLVIASLTSMQKDSNEIARAKELAAMPSESSKVNAVLMKSACVGDAEDLKYTAFCVDSINKKSSSTFKMTGLTGAANGHFGSEASGGLQTAKWRRMEQ